jgi:enoyl-CoA hydratase/carnithine racemase
LALGRELAALSGETLSATIVAVNVGQREGQERGLEAEAQLFGALCERDDWREGTRAFLEKRQPRFGGQ